MKALYLYPVWLRLWHWGNALLFGTLLYSGASMHYSGTPGLLPFEVAVTTHNTAGILMTLGWLVFLIGNLTSGNSRHYRVQFRGLLDRLFRQASYYGYGIFHNAPHPFEVSEAMKLNTLQQLSYIGIMFGLMPLLMLSGWAFLYSVYLPETLFGVGTVWIVAMSHLLLSYLMVLFVLVHMYIITTGETVLTNLKAMITGWHRESEEHS